ncbi:MAG: hypothetical protein V3R94_12505 [Acidobacteriota bacterium]
MTILEFESSVIQNEAMISEAVESVVNSSQEELHIFVAGIGATEKRLVEAGEKSAGQDLVLASTLAEGVRTFLIQVAHQLTSNTVSTQTQSLLSELFDEFSNLLEGVFLIGGLSPVARKVLASYAERAGAIIIAQAIQEKGLPAQAVCGRQIHLSNGPDTSQEFQEKTLADFQHEISALSQAGSIPVIPLSLHPLAISK